MLKFEHIKLFDKFDVSGRFATTYEIKKRLNWSDTYNIKSIVEKYIDYQHSCFQEKMTKYRGYYAYSRLGHIIFCNAKDINYIFIYLRSKPNWCPIAVWHQEIDFDNILDHEFLLEWLEYVLDLYKSVSKVSEHMNFLIEEYKDFFPKELWTQIVEKKVDDYNARVSQLFSETSTPEILNTLKIEKVLTINNKNYIIKGQYKTIQQLCDTVNMTEDKTFLQQYCKSVFNIESKRYFGYMVDIIDADEKHAGILLYYNIDGYNVILSCNSVKDLKWGFSTLIAFWKQNVNISINHEFLTKWLSNIFEIYKTKDLFKAKLYSVQYQQYFSEKPWEQIVNDEKLDKSLLKDILKEKVGF